MDREEEHQLYSLPLTLNTQVEFMLIFLSFEADIISEE